MKTHAEHLAEYGYTPDEGERKLYDPKETEQAWRAYNEDYGEGNVWDYRILGDAFKTSNAHFSYGMMFNVVKKDTGEVGSLNQNGSPHGAPRFYFDFVPETP